MTEVDSCPCRAAAVAVVACMHSIFAAQKPEPPSLSLLRARRPEAGAAAVPVVACMHSIFAAQKPEPPPSLLSRVRALIFAAMSEPVKPAAAQVVELATDPGLIILYDVDAVHIALGQANSPVTQGATPGQSLDYLKQYVYTQILSTPISDKENAVRKCDTPGAPQEFFPELFHRLPADTYRAVIEHLHEVFVRANHPVARWSVNAAASTHDPNSFAPNRPLGSLIKVLGGVGQGQATFERVAVSHGIFRISS